MFRSPLVLFGDGSAPTASSWLALISVGDGALAAVGGLVLHHPWWGCREPSNLLFLHKMFGWFGIFSFSGTYFPPTVLERETVEPGLGLCCWPLSTDREGWGELRAQTHTGKSPGVEPGALSKLCCPEVACTVFAEAILFCCACIAVTGYRFPHTLLLVWMLVWPEVL